MPIHVLGRGGRIAGGVFVGLFALQTFGWLLHDVGELGIEGAWSLWLGSADTGKLDAIPATTGTDLGLFVLQIGAVFAAFTAARAAGGLLAAAVTTTFFFRLPTLWIGGNHTPDEPWYVGNGDDAAVVPGILLGVLTVLLAAVLGIVLTATRRRWPPVPAPAAPVAPGWPGAPAQPPTPPRAPEPAEAPARPAGTAAVVTALVLGVLALTDLAWNGYLVFQGGVGFWGDMFSGSGTVGSVLGVPPAFRWLVLAVLCGLGAILAVTRSIAARGFALGAALLLVPEGILTTLWYLDHGLLLELGNSGAEGLAGRLQTFVTLVGGIAVLVLMGRPGTPVDEQEGTAPHQAPGGAFPAPHGPGGWQQGWGQPAQPGPGQQPARVPQQPTAPPAWGPQHGAPQPGPVQQPPHQQPPAGYGYPPPPVRPPGTPQSPPQGTFGPPPPQG